MIWAKSQLTAYAWYLIWWLANFDNKINCVLEDLKSLPWKMQLLHWTQTHGFCRNVFCPPRYPLAPPYMEDLAKIGWVLLLCINWITGHVLLYIELAKRLWVRVQLQPIFFIWMFNYGARGASRLGYKMTLNKEHGAILIDR